MSDWGAFHLVSDAVLYVYCPCVGHVSFSISASILPERKSQERLLPFYLGKIFSSIHHHYIVMQISEYFEDVFSFGMCRHCTATTGKRSDLIHFSGIQVGNLTSNPGTETLPATSCPCWFLHSSHGDRLVFFKLFSISPSFLFRHSPCERHWSLVIAHRAVFLLPSGVYLSICEGVVAQEVVFFPNAIWKTLILACAEYFTMMGKTS